MKKLILVVFALISIIYAATAQKDGSEKVRALKIAFITERLQLTSAEAQKFWPVYNDYEKEVSSLWSSYHRGNSGVLDNEERLLQVRRKYSSSFERILGKGKANTFFQAEQDFRGVLLKSLRSRSNNRSGNSPKH